MNGSMDISFLYVLIQPVLFLIRKYQQLCRKLVLMKILLTLNKNSSFWHFFHDLFNWLCYFKIKNSGNFSWRHWYTCYSFKRYARNEKCVRLQYYKCIKIRMKKFHAKRKNFHTMMKKNLAACYYKSNFSYDIKTHSMIFTKTCWHVESSYWKLFGYLEQSI